MNSNMQGYFRFYISVPLRNFLRKGALWLFPNRSSWKYCIDAINNIQKGQFLVRINRTLEKKMTWGFNVFNTVTNRINSILKLCLNSCSWRMAQAYRSSRQRCSIKMVFLEISQNSQENKFKKGLWQRCFPLNFEKFLKTPFLQNTTGQNKF